MRRGEVARLIGRLKDDAQLGSVVDVRARLTSLSADATCLMLFGRRYEEETGMVEVVPESMELGIRRRMRAVHRVYDGILERIIEEHRREGYQGQARDFVDVLLAYMDSRNTEFPIDDTIVKAILTLVV
ncbi:hypothetical protein QJS10_CPB20g01932 [Acorus calamus]|uniref:Cytochrome P450 n=1 Tax=Acorus calamus TaxID=4465 RepID=A0AAV9CE94_ACOCL|nr:hypothetical protein QJS10_CPB20g01932 [Acorus calamus]